MKGGWKRQQNRIGLIRNIRRIVRDVITIITYAYLAMWLWQWNKEYINNVRNNMTMGYGLLCLVWSPRLSPKVYSAAYSLLGCTAGWSSGCGRASIEIIYVYVRISTYKIFWLKGLKTKREALAICYLWFFSSMQNFSRSVNERSHSSLYVITYFFSFQQKFVVKIRFGDNNQWRAMARHLADCRE
jgi:hypothetical protein